MKNKTPHLWAIIGAVCFVVPNLQAGPIINQTYAGSLPATITGTLSTQDTALEEAFTLSSASNLTITTTSYATGGFQTNLFLYNSAGSFITAGVPFGAVNAGTGIVGDMRLIAINLPAGMYTVALTDFLLNQSTTATNLSAGFTNDYGTPPAFTDENGNVRTGNYSFTITAVSPAAIPEPATWWLAAPLILGLAAKKRFTGLTGFVR